MFIWSPTNLIVKYLCSSLPSVQHYCFCEVPLAPEVIVWLLVILAPLLALVRLEALHRGFLPSRSVQDLPKPSSFEYLWYIVFLELNIFPKFSMVWQIKILSFLGKFTKGCPRGWGTKGCPRGGGTKGCPRGGGTKRGAWTGAFPVTLHLTEAALDWHGLSWLLSEHQNCVKP